MTYASPLRMRSSHEKFPVRAPRTIAHKLREPIAKWSYDPKAPPKLVKSYVAAR